MRTQILRTVEYDNGVFFDFAKTKQGFAIQRNSKTIYGRLTGYGGLQIFADCILSYSKKHKIVSDTKRHELQFVGTVVE